MAAPTTTTPVHLRVRAGMSKPHNWLQLVRFAAVGASGYIVNLLTFAILVHSAGLDYRLAATGAFLVAVTNNFLWNRRWTFRARDGHRNTQAARFLSVSVLAFAFNLLVLWLFVDHAGVPEVPAQAAAIVAATPLSFIGNKLWSFAR
ncbi:MAG: GtrA family protein [Solirubrobacteraceae bacterium]|nr:GtrA family protein [Solirubrobacteraceae bacterium]